MINKKLSIELIHPPHPESIEDRLDAPLGLLYIAANLEKKGYNVRVNDLSGISEKDWNIGNADIYGITMYAPTIEISEKIAKMCHEKNPSSKVGVGGAHPTADPRGMGDIFDFVGIGEGEELMVDVARDYPNTKRFYRRELNKNLDEYPNPAYHLIDLKSYKRTLEGELALTMLTSRGCPFRCTFCGLPDHHKKIKTRSPERVAEEIKEIKENYGIERFIFQDDLFTSNKKRLHKTLELITPLNIKYKAHGRSGTDRYEDYVKIKESGGVTIAHGLESGSQKILDLMNKRTTVKNNKNVVEWGKKAGLITRAFFVFGFPGETRETVEETKKFIEEVNPDQYFVSNFVPYPDTDVWNNPEKYGVTKIFKDFKNYFQVDKTGFGSCNIETKDLSVEEFKILEREFRGWVSQREQKGRLQEYDIKLKENKKK